MKMRGFTLVELMITVAVLSILSAIAIPSYSEYMRRAHRSEMQSVMLEAAQYMQRYYTVNNAYNQDRAGKKITLPDSLSRSPRSGGARYTIEVTANSHDYTLRAKPTAATKDPCGTFVLDNTGRKSLTGNDPKKSDVQRCWR